MNIVREKITFMRKNNRGAAALLMIVIIAIASLLMAGSASRLGLGELEMGYDEEKGAAALAFADGCAEEALARLRKDSSYAGATVNAGGGSCILTVTGSGINRIIYSTATLNSYTKKIEMHITINSSLLSIIDWNEVSP